MLAEPPLRHLAQAPCIQAQAQQVELGLAEHSPQAKKQAIVVAARVVDCLGIRDQRADERGEVEQFIPIGIVAREPARLVGEDDPDVTERDVGHQFLEPLALAVAPRVAQVGVDHMDALWDPAQGLGPLGQCILVVQALAVLLHLRG